MAYTYKYPRPALTADCIVFSFDAEGLKVLLVERGQAPFAGHWAFPGGFMEMEETAGACALRELKEETGITAPFLRQVGAFSAIERDPRGRTVTVAFYTWIHACRYSPVAGDDAAKVGWYPVNAVPPLAFDHAEVLAVSMDRLKEELMHMAKGEQPLWEEVEKQEVVAAVEWIGKYWKGSANYDADYQ